jgi:cytochrome c biogenesis protein CcmG/thiol:disulfide interchange protein DsbE
MRSSARSTATGAREPAAVATVDEATTSTRHVEQAGVRASLRRYPIRWAALSIGTVVVIAFTLVFAGGLAREPTLVKSRLIGRPAPQFDAPGLDGGRVATADYAGQVYIVNFWASWCVPCREEAPYLEDFARRWEGRVTLIGVVYNDLASAARDFRDEFGLSYPQVLDEDASIAVSFGVRGIPETYVIAPDGTVKAALIGAVGPRTLDEVLAQVLDGEEINIRNDDYRTGPNDR